MSDDYLRKPFSLAPAPAGKHLALRPPPLTPYITQCALYVTWNDLNFVEWLFDLQLTKQRRQDQQATHRSQARSTVSSRLTSTMIHVSSDRRSQSLYSRKEPTSSVDDLSWHFLRLAHLWWLAAALVALRASTMALKLLMRSIRRGSCDAPSKCGTQNSSLNSIHYLLTNLFILLPLFRLINHVMKQGSGTANTLGTLAVLYSACGVLLQYIRDQDDNVNTIIAGSATGLLYKSTGESIPLMQKTFNTQSYYWFLQLAFENVP